jgi:hypothetical protein
VTAQAPRLDRRLVAAAANLDDERDSIAATNRRVGEFAELIGLHRPSYQQVRLLVHEARRRERARRAARELILDVEFRRRPPVALLELLDS